MGIGWQEILIIFFVVLLFFGAKRIPEIARALGKASREFKKAKDGVVEETKKALTDDKVDKKDDDDRSA